MNIRSLKRVLRTDFNNYIRNLVIKDKCENCGKTSSNDITTTKKVCFIIRRSCSRVITKPIILLHFLHNVI